MFMLGSFVNGVPSANGGLHGGLFGGASDVFSLANSYMNLKERMRMNSVGDNIENAMKSGAGSNDATTNGLYGSPTAGADQTRPDYETFDDDPLLNRLPKPGRVKRALEAFGDSPREGKAYGSTPTQAGTPSSPREGKNFGGTSSTAMQRLSSQAGPLETEGAQGGSDPLPWLSDLGQKIRTWAQGYDHRAPPGQGAPQQPVQQPAPPQYLPQQTPPVPGALMMPGMAPGGVPYAGAPGLGNQQSPLAALMAPYNPTGGSVT